MAARRSVAPRMRLIRTSRLMSCQWQVVRADQEVPDLMFLQYERKRAFNRAFYGGRRVARQMGHAVLYAGDGIAQVPGQPLGGGRQTVGLGLRHRAVEGGTQRWKEGGHERQPQLVNKQMHQSRQGRQPKQRAVDPVDSMKQSMQLGCYSGVI